MLGHRRDLVVSMFTKMIPLGTFGRERQVLPEESGHETMYRPTIESDFSVPVVFHPEGRVETFKYLGSELICEACGTARAKSNGSILSGLAPVATRRDGDGQEN